MRRTTDLQPKRPLLSNLLVLAAGAALGAGGMYLLGPAEPAGKSKGKATTPPAVQAYGRIEPAAGLVPIFGSPGDRIVAFLANGDGKKADEVDARFKRDAPLVRMASDDLREQETKIAWQQVQDARDQRKKVGQVADAKRLEAEQEIENLQRGQKAELDGQRSRLGVAERQVQHARTQFERLRSLTAGSVSGADLRQKELDLNKAEAELEAGRAAFRAAEKALEDGQALARIKRDAAAVERERAVKAVPVEVAEKTYQAAKLKQKAGQIVAPIDGKVVRVQAVAGETTTQVKAILLLAGQDDQEKEGLIVRVEIPEGEVERVRAELERTKAPLPVTITSRTVKDFTLNGKLASPEKIARAITRNTVVDLAPSTGSDRRVVEAVIDVTDDADKLRQARSLLGLQVEVKIPVPEPK